MASLISPRPIPSTPFPIHHSRYSTLHNPSYAASINELQIQKSYSLFCDVTQHTYIVTDVSGQPIGLIFKGRTVQKAFWTA